MVVTESAKLVTTEVDVMVATVAVLREMLVVILTTVVTVVESLVTVDWGSVVGFNTVVEVVVLKAVCRPPMIVVLVFPGMGEVTVVVVGLGWAPAAVAVKKQAASNVSIRCC
jgi:hypothetical protein